MIHGAYKKYYENGILKEELQYIGGRRTRQYKRYNESGELYIEVVNP